MRDPAEILPAKTRSVIIRAQFAHRARLRGARLAISFAISMCLLFLFTGCGANPRRHSDKYIRAADGYLSKELFELASQRYEQAVSVAPTYGRAYYKRGMYYLKRKNQEMAYADFTKAIEFDPQLGDAYLQRGGILLSRKETDQAMKDLAQASQLNQTDSTIFSHRALLLYNQGKYVDAIKDYKKLEELSGLDAENYAQRAMTHLQLGDLEAAERDFAKCFELNPELPIAFLYRMRFHACRANGMGMRADAAKYIDLKTWADKETPRAIIYIYLGECLTQSPSKAENILHRSMVKLQMVLNENQNGDTTNDTSPRRQRSEQWPFPLLRYFTREWREQELLAVAKTPIQITEARVLMGFDLLIQRQRAEAIAHFQWVVDNGSRACEEYVIAKSIIQRTGRK